MFSVIKLGTVDKTCLNETYSKDRIFKHISDWISYSERSERRRCFTATVFYDLPLRRPYQTRREEAERRASAEYDNLRCGRETVS
jgi:hypothetical protein